MRGFGFGPARAARRARAAVVTPPPVILAILCGQSNAEGRIGREAQDVDVAHVKQFVGYSGDGNYRTLQSDITPLWSYGGYTDVSAPADRLGPGEHVARQLIADNPTADVVLVPTAIGSTAMASGASPPWASSASLGGGGTGFNNMVDQANRAYVATQAACPGRPISVVFFFVQGEQDAANGCAKATYYAALSAFIDNARALVTGASNAPFVIGSMVPEKWAPLKADGTNNTNFVAAYAAINHAHVDASLNKTNVRYAVGPTYSAAAYSSTTSGDDPDNLHYRPAQRCRDQGTRLAAALSDASGPSVTTPTTYTETNGHQLFIPLTGSDEHQTFHLNGGADVARFEVSDAYLSPGLRWVGDGTGPAANGAYVVKVRARDGAGNYGADRTITVTVAAVGQVSPATAFTSGQRGMVWDLSDLSSLFQDVAGTVSVTAAGQRVGKVLDKSGNNNHWVAAADNNTRPVYVVDADARPLLRFTGSGENRALLAATPFITPASNLAFTAAVGVLGGAQSDEHGILAMQAAGTYIVPFESTGANSDVGMNMRNSNGDGGSNPSLSGMLDGSTKRVLTAQFDAVNGVRRMRNEAGRSSGGVGGWTSTTGQYLDPPAYVTRTALGAGAGISAPSDFLSGDVYSGYAINEKIGDAKVANFADWIAARTLTGALP